MWMQSMHPGAQHTRAATATLMAVAEALCTQGGCTLVHCMWQNSPPIDDDHRPGFAERFANHVVSTDAELE